MKTLEKKTVADYEALPEGSPYQLIEGELIMSPAPGFEHFRSSKRVFVRLFRLIEDQAKVRSSTLRWTYILTKRTYTSQI